MHHNNKYTYLDRFLLSLSISVIIICIGSLFIVTDWYPRPIYLILFVIMLLIAILSYTCCNRYLTSSWFRPSYLFLFALIIVNFQTNIDVLINMGNLEEYLRDVSYNKYFGKTFLLSVISVLSFVFGNTLIKVRSDQSRYTQSVVDHMNIWLLGMIVSFVCFVISIDIASFISGAIYHGSGAYDRSVEGSSRWEMLFDVFMTIVLSINTYRLSKYKKGISFISYIRSFPFIFIIVVILYLILRLLSGDRGPVIYTVLLLLFSYAYVTKINVKFGKVLLTMFLSALIMTLLNSIRMQDSSLTFKEKIGSAINYMKYEYDISTISPYTYELAQSVLCNYIAVADIDQNKTDIQYGRYNFYELVGTIPGSSTLMYKLFNVDIAKESTAEYVTQSHFGKYYPYGLGTTAIVDFYLDFGIFGVIVGFLLLGLLFQRIDNIILNSKSVSFLMLLFAMKIASMAIYIPRSSLSFVLSRVGYTIFIFIVINWIICNIRKI